MMTKGKLFLSLLMVGAVVGSATAQRLKDAKAAMEAEQYDKAKEMLQTLVDKKPKDGENYFYLGQIYLINEKVDSAALIFGQGLTNAPKETLNQIGMGIVDLEKGNETAAEQKFVSATSDLKKKDYLPLYYIGRAYIDAPKPDYAKAIDYLTQAKAKNLKDPEILVGLGDAYSGIQGEASNAYVNYRDALNLDPNLVRAHVGQAIIQRRAQAYDVALENLSEKAKEYPSFGPIYRELAETQLELAKTLPDNTDEEKAKYESEIKKAVDYYKQYLQVTGDKSVEANVRYADFLVWGQQYEELKNVALQLANAPGVDAKVYRYLGLIAVNQDGDFEKGAEYFDKLFAEADTSRLIDIDYLFAGFANIQTGKADKGVPYLAKALEKNPEIMPEIGSAGMLAFQQGNYDVASAILSVPAKQKGTDYYYEANYVLGNASFRSGVAKKEAATAAAQGDSTSVTPVDTASYMPDFRNALKAFDVIIKSNDQKVYDEYLAGALYLTGYVNISLDNVNPETPELCKGLFVPAFTQLTQLLKDKQLQGKELTDAERGYLVDAYNYIGYYHVTKEDYASALASFEETVKVAPNDEFAKAYIEYLKS
ncbi:tetratricopeptide repeat protein [Sphingobacterium sp. SGG-5]|uniref:tetratricopeptide repeat protein n=1 Tax=Sphingobacterium sp. SGG-5 TaxID=2710881 RepID=UPI001F0F549D|nr:tetratricopeptide repeat protein [Sphingobacterium sp. SGG-5]